MTTVRSVTVALRADISSFQRGLVEAGAEAQAFASKLDSGLSKVDDRMSNLTASVIALGPALVPVAAAASVGIAALGTQLTFAATGAGVALLALKGVAGALKALDTYSGAPTQANLTALQGKLAELAPAGQSFVFFLDSLRPKLDQLRASAQQGFLPGLQDGITSVLTQFPIVNQLTSQLATTLGDLARQGGEALQSPFWTHFLEDFGRNASVALRTMSEGLGNIAHGLAGVFDAFIPVGDSLSQKLLQLSQEFAAWGQSLSQNQGFQQFIQYVESNGGRVLDTLASIAKALLAIAQAAAPVGAATLPVIKALADGLAAIANSPAGPAIIGAAVAITSLAKALALLKAVGGIVGLSSALKGAAAGATAAEAEAAAASAASSGTTAAAGGAAAGIGLRTGVGAAFAVAALPWAALYSGYSLASKATDTLATAQKNLNTVMGSNTISFRGQSQAIREIGGQVNSYWANQQRLNHSVWDTLLGNPWTITRDAVQSDFANPGAANAAHAAQLRAIEQQRQWIGIAQQLHQGFAGPAERVAPLPVLQATLDRKLPILEQQFGHSVADIRGMSGSQAGVQELVDELTAYKQASLEAAKPTAQLQAAIAGLNSKLVPTATAAQNVTTALSNLLSPGLNLSAATDQWVQGLQALDTNLSKNTKSLQGFSAGAEQNRGVIRAQVQAFSAVASAGAAVGETSQQFGHRLQMMYDNLIKTGVGAGIAKKDLVGYLTTLGLTPKTIKTIIETSGVDKAVGDAKRVAGAYNALPKNVRTDIAANGIPTTKAEVDALQKKYGLTPKQINTIISARDNASVVIDGVRANLSRLNGQTSTVRIVTQHLEQFLQSGVQVTPSGYGNLLTFGLGGTLPPVGRQAPQMRNRGQGALLWNENPHSEWEAFISGDPAAKGRSMGLVNQVVNRLSPGSRVDWYAGGGLIPQRAASGATGAAGGSLAAQIGILSRDVRDVRRALTDGSQKATVDPGPFDSRSAAISSFMSDRGMALQELLTSMDEQ